MDRGALRSLSPRLPAILSALLLAALVAAPVYTGEQLVLPERTLEQAEKQYGPGARKRLLAWQELLRTDRTDNDRAKIERVNRFFNRLNFVDDALHWHKADYWATPVEFLASEGGRERRRRRPGRADRQETTRPAACVDKGRAGDRSGASGFYWTLMVFMETRVGSGCGSSACAGGFSSSTAPSSGQASCRAGMSRPVPLRIR